MRRCNANRDRLYFSEFSDEDYNFDLYGDEVYENDVYLKSACEARDRRGANCRTRNMFSLLPTDQCALILPRGYAPELLLNEALYAAFVKRYIGKLIDTQARYPIFLVLIEQTPDVLTAEIVASMRDRYPQIRLMLAEPREGVQLAWPPELRDRYYAVAAQADRIETFHCKVPSDVTHLAFEMLMNCVYCLCIVNKRPQNLWSLLIEDVERRLSFANCDLFDLQQIVCISSLQALSA